MSAASDIVRALAATDPYERTGNWCGACGVVVTRGHAPDCLWLRAVEWTGEHGASTVDMETRLGAIRSLSRPGYPPGNADEIVAEIHWIAVDAPRRLADEADALDRVLHALNDPGAFVLRPAKYGKRGGGMDYVSMQRWRAAAVLAALNHPGSDDAGGTHEPGA